jgi:hypothetical protein
MVKENLEREKTNKSQAINTRDTCDLFYRGSVLENLIPAEESTKDGSFSTLSLFHRSPRPASSSSLSQGSLRPRKDHHTLRCLLLDLLASRNLEEDEWESKLHAQMITRCSTHFLSMILTRHYC